MSPPPEPQRPAPRVFISYSQHDPAGHSLRVRALAQALSDNGIDVELDQYHQNELIDWPRWCEEQLRPENSDFVLMMCSTEYKRRIENRVNFDKGRGVFWEGNLIYQYLYKAKANERFIPILLDDEVEESLPLAVANWTRFRLRGFGIASRDVGYRNLYRSLTTQPAVIKPKPGQIISIPPESSPKPVSVNIRGVVNEPVPAPGPTTKPVHNLPFRPNPSFFARKEEMERLRHAFERKDEGLVTRTVAVHGLGGVGKTQLAIAYAYAAMEERSYDFVLWLRADEALLDAGLAGLSRTLLLPEAEGQETQLEKVLAWLASHDRWLLLVDNVDTPATVDNLWQRLPITLRGHLLITSRRADWPDNVPSIPLEDFAHEEAVAFLLQRAPHAGSSEDARTLAAKLQGLPLALEQAAAYVCQLGCTFADYLEDFQRDHKEIIQGQHIDPRQYPDSLARTWRTTIKKLEKPLARTLLRFFAWFAPGDIPRKLFTANPAIVAEAPGIGGPADRHGVNSGLMELAGFSLIRIRQDSGTISIHPLVQLVERDEISVEDHPHWIDCGIRLINATAPNDPENIDGWRELHPHCQVLLDHAFQCNLADDSLALLCHRFGRFLYGRRDNAQAERLLRGALEINEKKLGKDHPQVADVLSDLANVLQATRQMPEAESRYRRAIEISEARLGEHDPIVATKINDLAELLRLNWRMDEAEPLYRRALEINEASFGSKDRKVAMVLNNLGLLMQDIARMQEAEEYTARIQEAEEYFRRALRIDEEMLGQDHVEVAIDLNNLATLLQETSRLQESELHFQRALTIFEKSLPSEHPYILHTRTNLARLRKEMRMGGNL